MGKFILTSQDKLPREGKVIMLYQYKIPRAGDFTLPMLGELARAYITVNSVI